jgi:uncharacterized protein YkwD
MLSKKPIDLRLYSVIFRQDKSSHELAFFQTNAPSMSACNQSFINRARSSHGLCELDRSPELDYLARHHAERMVLRESIFHSCRTVGELQIHLDSRFVGENVQRGESIRNIHENMMASRSQRQNVLCPQFQEFGIGTSKAADGTIYMVQLFRAVDKLEACDCSQGRSKSKWVHLFEQSEVHVQHPC